MMNYNFILNSFLLLEKHKPGKLILLFFLTLFQGLNSGFSVVLLIPLLQLLNIGSGELPEGPALFFRTISEMTGIQISVETVLIVYVFILTINALIQYWISILDARYQSSLIHSVRRRMFRKVILADWPLLNSKSKTNHIQVITKEIPVLANYYYYFLRLLTSLVTLTAFVAYAMIISMNFTLIIIASGLLLFFLLRKYLVKAFHLGEETVDSYNRLLKYIDDFWQSVKIAKVHSSEGFYYEKFDEANSSLLDLESGMQKNYNLPQLIYRIAGILVLVVVIYAGYKTGDVPLASFFILIILFAKIFPHFIGINTDISMILSYLPSVRLVFNIDQEFPDNNFTSVIPMENRVIKQEIKLDKISFAYADNESLFRDITLTIPANRITGITGESGIGKTTLIDIIAGLQKPSAGHILIDGEVLDDDLIKAWRSGIGYLPQDPFFIDGTLRENLIWDSYGNTPDSEIYEVLEMVNAGHLVKRLEKGLDTYIVNYPYCFSGGECQRLALARVLLRKPQLLLLDEATSSLDFENESVIMEVISKVSNKVTVVFVTHKLNLLPYFHNTIQL